MELERKKNLLQVRFLEKLYQKKSSIVLLQVVTNHLTDNCFTFNSTNKKNNNCDVLYFCFASNKMTLFNYNRVVTKLLALPIVEYLF